MNAFSHLANIIGNAVDFNLTHKTLWSVPTPKWSEDVEDEWDTIVNEWQEGLVDSGDVWWARYLAEQLAALAPVVKRAVEDSIAHGRWQAQDDEQQTWWNQWESNADRDRAAITDIATATTAADYLRIRNKLATAIRARLVLLMAGNDN